MDRITARLAHAGQGAFVLDRVDIAVTGATINRQEVLQHRRLVIDRIDTGTVTGEMSQADFDRLVGLPITLDEGAAHVKVGGVTVTARVSISNNRLVVASIVAPLSIPVPSLPVLPCSADVRIAAGRLIATCIFHQIPPAFQMADPVMSVVHHATALADGIEAALPAWVERSVQRVRGAFVAAGGVCSLPDGAVAAAGRQAAEAVGPPIRRLLAADIDEQRTTPLAIVRALAVPYPTAVLRAAGIPPVERDSFSEAAFPDDIYDLAPASFADLDPGLADAGIAWGAAKAFEHRRRHGVPPGGDS